MLCWVGERDSHKPEGYNEDLKVRVEDEKAAHAICDYRDAAAASKCDPARVTSE